MNTMNRVISGIGVACLALAFGLVPQPTKAEEMDKTQMEDIMKKDELSTLVDYVIRFGGYREDGGKYITLPGENERIYLQLIPLREVGTYKVFFLHNTERYVPIEKIPEPYRQEMVEQEMDGKPFITSQIQVSKKIKIDPHIERVVEEGEAFIENAREVFFSRTEDGYRRFFGREEYETGGLKDRGEELFEFYENLFLRGFKNLAPSISRNEPKKFGI